MQLIKSNSNLTFEGLHHGSTSSANSEQLWLLNATVKSDITSGGGAGLLHTGSVPGNLVNPETLMVLFDFQK